MRLSCCSRHLRAHAASESHHNVNRVKIIREERNKNMKKKKKTKRKAGFAHLRLSACFTCPLRMSYICPSLCARQRMRNTELNHKRCGNSLVYELVITQSSLFCVPPIWLCRALVSKVSRARVHLKRVEALKAASRCAALACVVSECVLRVQRRHTRTKQNNRIDTNWRFSASRRKKHKGAHAGRTNRISSRRLGGRTSPAKQGISIVGQAGE